jgi:hypothetical protein
MSIRASVIEAETAHAMCALARSSIRSRQTGSQWQADVSTDRALLDTLGFMRRSFLTSQHPAPTCCRHYVAHATWAG